MPPKSYHFIYCKRIQIHIITLLREFNLVTFTLNGKQSYITIRSYAPLLAILYRRPPPFLIHRESSSAKKRSSNTHTHAHTHTCFSIKEKHSIKGLYFSCSCLEGDTKYLKNCLHYVNVGTER